MSRLHDAILTRLSNDDDLEKSLSTFANEMTTSAMILGLVTPMSLVLVDELGRGTSPRDGIGISHAIAEALIGAKVRLLVDTPNSGFTDYALLVICVFRDVIPLDTGCDIASETSTQALQRAHDNPFAPAYCC